MGEVKFDPARLIGAMRKAGMGDAQLATAAGISRQMVFYLRKGKRNSVSAEVLGKIAAALEISVDSLLQESGPQPSPLPGAVRQLTEIAVNLSETRQEELARIASVLAALDQERQTKEMPHNFLGGIEAAMNVFTRRRGQEAGDELIDLLKTYVPELRELMDSGDSLNKSA